MPTRALSAPCLALLSGAALGLPAHAFEHEPQDEDGVLEVAAQETLAGLGFGLQFGAAPALEAQEAEDGAQDDEDGGLLRRGRDKLGAPAVLRGPGGEPILPGEIPAGTSPEARATWSALIDRLGSPEPVESFRLAFDLRLRDPEKRQSNDLGLTFSYLAPAFVRAEFSSSRELLRGPRGDYLIDTKTEEVLKLVGREGAEDRRQLDRMAAIAKSFVGLTNPGSLRLAGLRLLGGAPEGLPPSQRTTAAELTWLELVSPDFFLESGGPTAAAEELPLYRARLGVDNETRLVRMALLHRKRAEGIDPMSATFVQLDKHRERSSLMVPHDIQIYGLTGDSIAAGAPRFRSKPDSLLKLDGRRGSLRARLVPEGFLPPEN